MNERVKKFIKPFFVAAALVLVVLLPAASGDPSTLGLDGDKPSIFPPSVKARAAFAQDLVTGEILYEKNADEMLPLASLSKIISSLVALDYINPKELVLVTREAVMAPEPSSLRVGERRRASELFAMAMGESSNDAMMALVYHLGDEKWFVELMREKSYEVEPRKEGGSTSFIFQNPTGLDLDQEKLASISGDMPSNFGSARALMNVIRFSLDSEIWQLGEIASLHSYGSIYDISGLRAAKTGYTDHAGGNVVLVVQPYGKNPVGIVVLGSTLEERFLDAKKILSHIHSKF